MNEFTIIPKTTYRLNVDKIQSLEDVKKVLDALNIQFEITEGLTSERYEKLKNYLDLTNI